MAGPAARGHHGGMDVDTRAGSWTLADLAGLPDSNNRYEVIDGNLIVSPAPSRWHQAVGSALLMQLGAACPPEWLVVYESYLDYGGDGRVPDLLVVRRAALRRQGLGYPPADVGLAIEIVSPSSRRTDRLAKPAEYADQGIELMWRVELEPEVVVHPFRRVGPGWLTEPEIRDRGQAPAPWGSVSIDLTEFAAGLS